jgi:hypothetical protein
MSMEPVKRNPRIPAKKFEALRRAILRVMVASGSRGATLPDLVEHTPTQLTDDERARLGSAQWHVEKMTMDLQARGEIVQLEGAAPPRFVRASRDAA